MYKIIPFSPSSENAIHAENNKLSFVFDSEKAKQEIIETIYNSITLKGYTIQNKINNFHLVVQEIIYLYNFINFVNVEDYKDDIIEGEKTLDTKKALFSLIDELYQIKVFSIGSLSYSVLNEQMNLKKSFVSKFLKAIARDSVPLIDLPKKLDIKKPDAKEYDLLTYNNCLFEQAVMLENQYELLSKRSRVHHLIADYWHTNIEKVELGIHIEGKATHHCPTFSFDMSQYLTSEQIDKLSIIEQYGNFVQNKEEELISMLDCFADNRLHNKDDSLSEIVSKDINKIILFMQDFEKEIMLFVHGFKKELLEL